MWRLGVCKSSVFCLKYGAGRLYRSGPGSSVGIATDYGLDGPGIESSNPGGARFSAVQTGPGAHPASCTTGTGSFPGVKYGRGLLLTTHLLLVPWSWKSRSITIPTFWATTGPVTGTLYLTYKLPRNVGTLLPAYTASRAAEMAIFIVSVVRVYDVTKWGSMWGINWWGYFVTRKYVKYQVVKM